MARSLIEVSRDPSELLDQPIGPLIFELGLSKNVVAIMARTNMLKQSIREFARNPFSVHPADHLGIANTIDRWLAMNKPPEKPATPADIDRIKQLAEGSGLADIEAWDLKVFSPLTGRNYTQPLGGLFKRKYELTHSQLLNVEKGMKAFLDNVALRQSQVEALVLRNTEIPRADIFLKNQFAQAAKLHKLYPGSVFDSSVQLYVNNTHIHAEVSTSFDYMKHVQWPSPGVNLDAQAVCECGRTSCLHKAAAMAYLVSNEKIPLEFFHQYFSPAWERLAHDVASQDEEKTTPPQALIVHLDERSIKFSLAKLNSKSEPSKSWRRNSYLSGELHKLKGRDLELGRCVALSEVNREVGLTDFHRLLVGFPRVVWKEEKEFRTCRMGEPRVAFEERPEGVKMSVWLDEEELLAPKLFGFRCAQGLCLMRRVGNDIVLYVLPQKLVKLVNALGNHGASFPTEALPSLHETAGRLESVARVDLPDSLRGAEVSAENVFRMQLSRTASEVELGLRVAPLANGSLFTPGAGVSVAATFDGAKRTWAKRDIESELRTANTLCAELGLEVDSEKEFTWTIPIGDVAVEVLRRLHEAASKGLVLEWKGNAARFTREAHAKQLQLKVGASKDWFDVNGTLEVDGQRVTLAELLEAARSRKRWIQVGADDFVQLSKELLEAVAPLAALGETKKSPTLTLGSLPAIEALGEAGADVSAASEWTKMMARLKAAKSREIKLPKIPVTPRDYQVVGYEWLTRLSDWSTGAILADDMGLGKTLQALMLLLSRSKLGPALVVAPTSVLHAWCVEAQKHAPSLDVLIWGAEGVTLKNAKKGTIILVTWTLFARESETLCAHEFATAILDEAQVIKNASTQRAKAAHQLKAKFIVALSGTPIENHVGELWSLFRAVMPSLLGNEESFRRRFGSSDEVARQSLARLIRPFILRRSKSQVATELPARTEVDVVIPLTASEKALYEDVRLTALAKVTGEAKKRFEVLAALTRLRLTACHPKLVDEQWKGPTSKLDKLEELLSDLTESGHRVLVFSQFTMHLALVQTALRKRGLAYSYLDGSTALTERSRLVEQFQAGLGGGVFLISLKAGGTGLTLTAADYVVHLDPWWNPAVEDQASDRAHRIGQKRPVTIYRLIAEGTIEQKILALHADKRELVDSLLDGTDAAGAMKTEELMALLKES
jgi:hypothetical protein